MDTVVIVLFSLVSCIHLVSCYFGVKTVRGITKCLLMPPLAAVYLLLSAAPNYLVIMALAFSFVGDVLLLGPKSADSMKPGIASFAVTHLLYIVVTVNSGLMQGIPIWAIVVIGLAFLIAGSLVYMEIRKYASPKLKLFAVPYVLLIFGMSALQTMVFVNKPSFGTVLLAVGSLFFIVSDTTLSMSVLKPAKKVTLTNFFVMITYILAQLLIVCGYNMVL